MSFQNSSMDTTHRYHRTPNPTHQIAHTRLAPGWNQIRLILFHSIKHPYLGSHLDTTSFSKFVHAGVFIVQAFLLCMQAFSVCPILVKKERWSWNTISHIWYSNCGSFIHFLYSHFFLNKVTEHFRIWDNTDRHYKTG